MRVKHYKLLASVAMLISLLALPLTFEAMVIEHKPVTEVVPYDENCVAKFELDPLAISKATVYTHLKYVYRVDPSQIDWWTYVIADASTRYGVPEKYMISMLAVESQFNPFPKKKGGLVGPGQIQSKYWKNNGKYNIYRPDENIYLAAKILRSYKDQCGNWDCALRSYNVGIGAHLKGQEKFKQKQYMQLINLELALLAKNKLRG